MHSISSAWPTLVSTGTILSNPTYHLDFSNESAFGSLLIPRGINTCEERNGENPLRAFRPVCAHIVVYLGVVMMATISSSSSGYSSFVEKELWKKINSFPPRDSVAYSSSDVPLCCRVVVNEEVYASTLDNDDTPCYLVWQVGRLNAGSNMSECSGGLDSGPEELIDFNREVKLAAQQCFSTLQRRWSASSVSSASTDNNDPMLTAIFLDCDCDASCGNNRAGFSNRFVLALSLCSSIEITIFKLLGRGSGDVSNALLRHALTDSNLCLDRENSAASAVGVQFLHYLFLPDGLNLRNLLWHGFISPADLDIRYVCLLYVLQRTLVRQLSLCRKPWKKPSCAVVKNAGEPVYSTSAFYADLSYSKQFLDVSGPIVESLRTHLHSEKLKIAMEHSFLFISNETSSQNEQSGRVEQVLNAFRDIQLFRSQAAQLSTCGCSTEMGKKYRSIIWSALLKLIPVLEQLLRVLFCVVNACQYATLESEEVMIIVMRKHLCAQEGSYYTTLDGFGQRSKHQLLLDPYLTHFPSSSQASSVASTSATAGGMDSYRPNYLPRYLGGGMYALLVDLFLAAAGANVRALLAHCDCLSRVYPSQSGDSSEADNESGSISERDRNADMLLSHIVELLIAVIFVLSSRTSVCDATDEVILFERVLDAMKSKCGLSASQRTTNNGDSGGLQPCVGSSMATTQLSDSMDRYTSCYHPIKLLSCALFDAVHAQQTLLDYANSRQICAHRANDSTDEIVVTVAGQQLFCNSNRVDVLADSSKPLALRSFGVLNYDCFRGPRNSPELDFSWSPIDREIIVVDKWNALKDNFIPCQLEVDITSTMKLLPICSSTARDIVVICANHLQQLRDRLVATLPEESGCIASYMSSLLEQSSEVDERAVQELLRNRMSLLSGQSISGLSSWIIILQVVPIRCLVGFIGYSLITSVLVFPWVAFSGYVKIVVQLST
jgi:hypothetical protein